QRGCGMWKAAARCACWKATPIPSGAWRGVRTALSGSGDTTVRVWDMESGRSLRVLEGHSAGVGSVAWSPDSRFALSGSEDKMVRVWDVETGRSLHALKGHSASIRSVAWSPDGRLALSGSSNCIVRVW